MPKRSNSFQQLVYLIQHQLSQASGAVVTESKMLADRVDGTLREADIVVELEQHGVPMVLCFECKDRAGRIDLPQMEQVAIMYGRLCDKLVVVSRSGFTRPALARARSEGIETVTFGAAESVDWKAYVDQYAELFFAGFDFKLLDHRIEYEMRQGTTPVSGTDPFVIARRDGSEASFDQFKAEVLANNDLGRQAMDRWYATPVDRRKPSFEFRFDFEPATDNPLFVVQGDRAFRVKKFCGRVSAKVSTAPIRLSPMQFQDACVLDGTVNLTEGALAGKPIRVVLTKRDKGTTLGTVVIPSADRGQAKVHHYKVEEESN